MIISVTKQYNSLTNTFSSYELVKEGQLIKSVPLDEANTDYQAMNQTDTIKQYRSGFQKEIQLLITHQNNI